jgi:hypothetical protein
MGTGRWLRPQRARDRARDVVPAGAVPHLRRPVPSGAIPPVAAGVEQQGGDPVKPMCTLEMSVSRWNTTDRPCRGCQRTHQASSWRIGSVVKATHPLSVHWSCRPHIWA